MDVAVLQARSLEKLPQALQLGREDMCRSQKVLDKNTYGRERGRREREKGERERERERKREREKEGKRKRKEKRGRERKKGRNRRERKRDRRKERKRGKEEETDKGGGEKKEGEEKEEREGERMREQEEERGREKKRKGERGRRQTKREKEEREREKGSEGERKKEQEEERKRKRQRKRKERREEEEERNGERKRGSKMKRQKRRRERETVREREEEKGGGEEEREREEEREKERERERTIERLQTEPRWFQKEAETSYPHFSPSSPRAKHADFRGRLQFGHPRGAAHLGLGPARAGFPAGKASGRRRLPPLPAPGPVSSGSLKGAAGTPGLLNVRILESEKTINGGQLDAGAKLRWPRVNTAARLAGETTPFKKLTELGGTFRRPYTTSDRWQSSLFLKLPGMKLPPLLFHGLIVLFHPLFLMWPMGALENSLTPSSSLGQPLPQILEGCSPPGPVPAAILRLFQPPVWPNCVSPHPSGGIPFFLLPVLWAWHGGCGRGRIYYKISLPSPPH
ncbi:RNA-binding protein 25, partial [Ophiophagus hannah]